LEDFEDELPMLGCSQDYLEVYLYGTLRAVRELRNLIKLHNATIVCAHSLLTPSLLGYYVMVNGLQGENAVLGWIMAMTF
jgi:hypothetical protein